ncbi:MAG TPA: SPOR domain-containing protein, partial [Gemmatimonadales bacterium]|nr:SPOR domain-containing protein [Gemmatimonadales bacterium]
GSDSIWVVDLESHLVAGAVEAEWHGDLPLVAGNGTLVVRRGDDVLALDLTAPGFPERGRVADGAEDRWVAPAWAPSGPAPAPDADGPDAVAADTAEPEAADSTAPAADRVYLQISSSQNPDWARELSDKLTAAGLPARVLQPSAEGDPYRVVLGPYASREAAEETGRSLGMPYFVISATDPAAP